MKLHRPLLALTLSFGVLCSAASAADGPKKSKDKGSATASTGKGELVKVGEKDAAWAKQARAAYPLKVCLTSDEKLGAEGENAEFIYREPGKPDRLVIFCCEGCEDDFKKEPAKYVAKLDSARKKAK